MTSKSTNFATESFVKMIKGFNKQPFRESKLRMMSRKLRVNYSFLFALLLMVYSISVYAADKYSSVKIHLPKNPVQRAELLGILEIDHYHEVNGAITAELSAKALALLKKYPYRYEVLAEDAVAALEAENKQYYASLGKSGMNSNQRVGLEQNGQTVSNIIATPAAFQVKPTLGGYYSFAEMEAAMDALVATYPGIAQKFSIGTSVEGREMWCIKISDNVATDETNEPELLYMGLHHAREAIGGASMIFLMQYLCEQYAGNTNVRYLVDNREFYIIPCANPDGWEYNRTTNPNGGGQWRKNRSDNGDGSFGVDLNRNWGIDWANCNGAIGASACGSATGSSDVYWGSAAFSEPETVNLRNFVQSRKFAVCMDQHSVGPYYSLPFGRLTRTLTAQDNTIYTEMSAQMGKYNGMRYGNTYQTLGYEVSGGMKDWLLIGDTANIGKVYGMTGEGSNGTSSVTFWPVAAEIVALCKGMVYQDLQLAYTAGSYVDFQDVGKINITTRTGTFNFKLRRIGLENKPVTVTVLPLQNITSVGAPVTVASIPAYNGTATGSISYSLPVISNGTSIKFVWKIETGGYTYYDTVVNVYNPTIPFTDNMESGKVGSKWTASGGWEYTNDAAYAGTKSLAESPGGLDYTNSSTRIITGKTNLNLSSARTAYITFWVKHRCENFQDKLQLQVSTNGTTWVEVSGQTTVREPGTADGSTIDGKPSLTGIRENWTREVFNISNYFGVSALRYRLVFTSDPGSSYAYGTDDGFNIDDFTVITSTIASSLTSASSPVSFTGRNQGTRNVLNLDMPAEENTGYYVVERSTNGVDYQPQNEFQPTGNNNNSNGYLIEDENPYSGENLYRVKMVNTDGTFRYTNLVALDVKDIGLTPTGINTIFPNPTNGQVTVNFTVTENESTYQLLVYGMTGQIVHSKQLKLTTGQHSITLDATDFAKGTYFIAFSNTANKVTYESKFVKL